VKFRKPSEQRFSPPRRGFEESGYLLHFLDVALPAVNGMAGAENVGAGGKPFLDQSSGNTARFLAGRVA
jgi:hypothetical protein